VVQTVVQFTFGKCLQICPFTAGLVTAARTKRVTASFVADRDDAGEPCKWSCRRAVSYAVTI
jgi:hypothetical protein